MRVRDSITGKIYTEEELLRAVFEVEPDDLDRSLGKSAGTQLFCIDQFPVVE